jgi:CubicO group peptidase (beta-lactamase class C family)
MIGSFFRTATTTAFLFVTGFYHAAASDLDVNQKLIGFDAYMAKILSDWNAPGIGVGIVVNDKLVFAKGYGYRDYEKKLPFTPENTFSDCFEYKAVHRGRRRDVSGGRKFVLG